MEIALIILTSALISAFLFAAYRLGVADGKKMNDEEKIKVDDRNMKLIRDYFDFVSYTGDTRKDDYGN